MSTPEPQRRRRPRYSKASQPQSDSTMVQPSEGTTVGDIVTSQDQTPQTPAPQRSSRSKVQSERQIATSPKRDYSASKQKRRAKAHRNPEDRPGSQPMPTAPASILASTSTTTPRPVSQNFADYYAGPTFHNSPAPSSLPIPKMFLRSASKIPTVDGAQSSSECRGSESSSSVDENSPTQRKTLLPLEQRPQEESPLDILFQAAKQEKAANATPAAASDVNHLHGPSFRSEHIFRSPSPANPSSVQQQYFGDIPGQGQQSSPFSRSSLETPPKSSHLPFLGGDGAGDTTSALPDLPSSGLTHEDELQIRKSEELKKLFMSRPSTQHTDTPSPSEVYGSVPAHTSPFGGFADSRMSLSNRSHSTGFGPKPPALNSTQTRNHFSSPSRSSRGPRPNSSNLRKEMNRNNDFGSANGFELSATQPPRSVSENSAKISRNEQHFIPNDSSPPAISTRSPFSDPDTVGSVLHGVSGDSEYGRHSPMKSMEDDLRRLLKMETSRDRILDVRS